MTYETECLTVCYSCVPGRSCRGSSSSTDECRVENIGMLQYSTYNFGLRIHYKDERRS